MKTSSNITKKKTPSYINALKVMTNWFFNKNRKKDELDKIIKIYNIDNNITKRFFLYVYNTPHLVYFINKYLNHLYNFNKFNTTDLLFSLTYLLDINKITKKSIPDALLYLKSSELADRNKQKIKEIFEEYFTQIYDKNYSETELDFFYDLVNLNEITTDDISQIDKHINGGKTTFTMDDLPNTQKTNAFILDINRSFPPGIKEFCDQAKQYIFSRSECKGCELFGKPTVILDTNLEDGGEVDIAFFGLNPGTEEVEIGKPFVGKAGKILRERMSLIPPHVKWIITNVILCHTRNESEIKNPDDVKSRCRELVEGIRQTFPSKIIVPLGAKASEYFGLKGGMTNLSGKVFTNNNQQIIPIIHPSAANYNADNLSKFKNDFATILNIFKPQKSISPANIIIPPSKTAEPQTIITDKFITQVTPDLTFFDSCELNDNKILLTYINKEGQKRYLIKEFNLHFYLKDASWRECDQMTNQVDAIINISGREKHMAIKLVRDKLKQIKNRKEKQICGHI